MYKFIIVLSQSEFSYSFFICDLFKDAVSSLNVLCRMMGVIDE